MRVSYTRLHGVLHCSMLSSADSTTKWLCTIVAPSRGGEDRCEWTASRVQRRSSYNLTRAISS